MKQTLFAVCGLGLAMLLAVSTQEREVDSARAKVDSEIEALAGQAATNVLAHIAAQPFDAQTVAGAVTDDPSALTPASDFPTGMAFAAASDVDDFHHMATHTYDSGTSGIVFEVEAAVRYVTESAVASGTPTFHKEVTVTVQHDALDHPVELKRIVSWP